MKRLVIALVTALVCAAGAARAADAPTIEDVKKAWAARQDAHKSFRIEWVEAVTFKVGAFSELAPIREPGPLPAKDVEIKQTGNFAADGEKAAGTAERLSYTPSTNTWNPDLRAAFFDGKTLMEINATSRPGWAAVTVRSGKDRAANSLSSVDNAPVLRVLRPLRVGTAEPFDFQKAKLSGRVEKFGDATCVEVVIKDDPTTSLWCDPAREFLPVSEIRRYSGGGGFDTSWKYRKDARGQWVLTGWEQKMLDRGGKARKIATGEVKKLELAPAFAAEGFAPKVPPSSSVTVYEDGVKKDEYLLRADGSKRVIVGDEQKKSYDDLARTNADGTPYVPAKK